MKVRDIMRRGVRVTRPGKPLTHAGQMMAESACGVIPVLGDDDTVVGMVTDRDICLALCRRDLPPSAIHVAEVMSASVYSCFADDDIRKALTTMAHHKVRRLVVVDYQDRLEAILSIDDIAQHAKAGEPGDGGAPLLADVARAFQEISAPAEVSTVH
jgi:CBS domain-containing protein